MLFLMFGLVVFFIAARNIAIRCRNRSEQHDAFAQHFNSQQKLRRFSGMHQPFLPTPQQRDFFQQHFSEYAFLLPESLDDLCNKKCSNNAVKIKPLSTCLMDYQPELAKPLAVGGLSGLLWATTLTQKNSSVIYMNDENAAPIAYGSAFRLEEDAAAEAPMLYKPSTFLLNRLFSALINPTKFLNIEKTGFFEWKTLDWIAWLRHPREWWKGINILCHIQKMVMQSKSTRQAIVQDVAKQCRFNANFYDELNHVFRHQLIFNEKGSVLIARTENEIKEFYTLQDTLKMENRSLNFLSEQALKQHYGFAPQGKVFAEKPHDRTLSPHVFSLCKHYLTQHNSTVINGRLKTIYIDKHHAGGIAEYIDEKGKATHLSFSKIVMSLGQQSVFDINNKRLFDITSARGVSMLAYLFVPHEWTLPSAMVCGDTNHLTVLTQKPTLVDHHRHGYLVRITAGACITPTVFEKSAVYYDASIALGLITAVRKAFGERCDVEPILVYGCNRQISGFGQTHWINPYPGVHIQYGAGGGGLTRAPDLLSYQNNFF